MGYKINPFTGNLDEVGNNSINFNYKSGAVQDFIYNGIAGSNATQPVNTIYGYYISIFSDIEIDRMLNYPVAAVAGNSTFGIYEVDPITLYPTNKIAQNNVNNGSAAIQFTTFAPTLKLKKGTYFICGVTSSAATFQCVNGNGSFLHGAGVSPINFSDIYQGLFIAFPYNAVLPAIFPAGAANLSGNFIIKSVFRIA